VIATWQHESVLKSDSAQQKLDCGFHFHCGFRILIVVLLVNIVKWEEKNRKSVKGNAQLHHANDWKAFL